MQIEAEHPVSITNPDKVLWPEEGITKLQYLHYLVAVAPYLLQHLKDRPLTMIRFPNGIHGHSFYQKDAPAGTPEWVNVVPIGSADRRDVIHSVLVDSVATLLWLGNLACLEMHVGFTTTIQPESPTAIAFDLDPSVPGFEAVREVAMALHDLLSRLELPHIAKTSGATGLQVFVPLVPDTSFEDTRVFTKAVADFVLKRLPNLVTLERLTKKRGRKVYVDYPQHGPNRTLIAPYSARATVYATVSAPVRWEELARGAVPEQFTVKTMPQRLTGTGDLMACGEPAKLHHIVSFLKARTNVSL